MTNAFDWRQYTDEERIKRGETKNKNDTALKRSMASTKALERAREDVPNYATLDIGKKTGARLAQKPKQFKIHKQ